MTYRQHNCYFMLRHLLHDALLTKTRLGRQALVLLGSVNRVYSMASSDMKYVPLAILAAVCAPPAHPVTPSRNYSSSCRPPNGCYGGCGCRGQGSSPPCTTVRRSGSQHSVSPCCSLVSSFEIRASDRASNRWRHPCRPVTRRPENKRKCSEMKCWQLIFAE